MLRFEGVLKTLPADTPSRRMMERVMDRADEVLLEGRQSLKDLREEGTAASDLPGALAQCGKELAQDREALFTFSVIGAPRPVHAAVCNEVYVICREALSNAFRHSQAGKIEAEITYKADGVRLTIRDDGCGMDQNVLDSGRAGHWGLRGMHERAREIGADLKIWSRSGAGTEVVVMIEAKVAYPDSRKNWFWRRTDFGLSRRKERPDRVKK